MMHPRVLYETKDEISYPLFLIFNKRLQLGILPGDWKLAEVLYVLSKFGIVCQQQWKTLQAYESLNPLSSVLTCLGM